MSDAILTRVQDFVLTLTFNRPEAKNALTYAMYEALASACDAASGRDDIRAVVLEGHPSAFGAGTDISLFRDLQTADDSRAYERRIENVLSRIEACRKPVIAAISGVCTGGSAVIAACCDLRIGTRDATIGFPIARTLGNCLSSNNLARLVALIGAARIKQMVFSAELLDGQSAYQAGFLTEVVDDHAALTARIDALSSAITGHAPLTLSATKQALARIAKADYLDDDLVSGCYTSADFREGMEAFLEKRKPRWQGK